MKDLDRAQEIFCRYDGSCFHMDRDGASDEYLSYRVPRDVEAEWLAEMRTAYLQALGSPDGWRSIYFLSHHADFGSLEELVAAPAAGVFWQRCAYEEELLKHLDRCGDGALSGPVAVPLRYDRDVLGRVLDRVESSAQTLAQQVRSERSVRRAESIRRGASLRRDAASRSLLGFWRWSNLDRVATPAHR